MNFPRIAVILMVMGSFLLTNLPAAEEQDDETFQPKLRHMIQAVVPLPLQNVHIHDARVIAKVEVDNSGKIQDLVAIYSSHVGLIERAENLLRKASIETGDLQEGETYRFDIRLPFQYPSDLGVQFKTAIDDVEIMVDMVKAKDLSVTVYKPNELDNLPRLLDRGQIYMPEDDEGATIVGEAKVEFYVNHLGEVRLPRILSSSHEEVSRAAIASVRDMKFEPPTVDGKPMVTIVRMPFNTK